MMALICWSEFGPYESIDLSCNAPGFGIPCKCTEALKGGFPWHDPIEKGHGGNIWWEQEGLCVVTLSDFCECSMGYDPIYLGC